MPQTLRKVMGSTPLGKASRVAPPPCDGPAPALAEPLELSPIRGIPVAALIAERERIRAIVVADAFDRRNRVACAQEGTPIDAVLWPLEYLRAWVEVTLVARVRWPDLFPREDVDDDGLPAWWTESDAFEMGLTVEQRTPRRRLPVPTLPGCQGQGGKCDQLRRYGDRFCPTCAMLELRRMRGAATTAP